jgi:cellulase
VKETGCLRPVGTNSPIGDVTSPDMTCGFLPKGATPATKKCEVAAGSKVGLQWNHESTAPTDDIIDGSHKGPCLVYLSRDNGATWFKVYENGLDVPSQTFCVTTLIANRGYLEVTLPADIAPGNYLMRGELIALHSAYDIGGAQPYVGCTELTITGSGKANPAGVAIPGAYKPTDPGLHINIYNGLTAYVIPGPPVYVPGASPNNIDNGDGNGSISGGGSGGLSPGGAAAVSIIMIGLVAGVVAIGVMFHRKHGHVFGFTFSKTGVARHSAQYTGRKNGDYVAYSEADL